MRRNGSVKLAHIPTNMVSGLGMLNSRIPVLVDLLPSEGRMKTEADKAIWAAMYGQEEQLASYLGDGVLEKSVQDKAIVAALSAGHQSVVDMLLSYGANVNEEEGLRAAVSNGQLRMAEWLVGRGANIVVRSDEAIRNATMNGHEDVALFLLSRNKSIRNHEALANAAENGMSVVIDELVKRGADVTLAFDNAVTRKLTRAVAAFVERDACGDVYCNDKAIVMVASAGYVEASRALCERTYTSELAQYEALRVAEVNGHSGVVQCIVKYISACHAVSRSKVTRAMAQSRPRSATMRDRIRLSGTRYAGFQSLTRNSAAAVAARLKRAFTSAIGWWCHVVHAQT